MHNACGIHTCGCTLLLFAFLLYRYNMWYTYNMYAYIYICVIRDVHICISVCLTLPSSTFSFANIARVHLPTQSCQL